MHIKAKFLVTACAAMVLGAVSAAKADDKTPADVPGSQGLTSVDKNLTRDPDNRGLTNAQRRIEDNIQDRKDRKANKADRDDKGMRAEKAERPEKADRPDRPDHPERAGRS